MIVHGSTFSPFVRKVVAFAAEKGVALENKPGNFGDKSPERLAMSPFGKIPAFEDGDYKLSDSSAIVQYIEAKHPDPVLIPIEAKARGRVIWFDEFADTIVVAALGSIFFNRIVAPMVGMPSDLALADKTEAEAVPPIFDYLECVIQPNGFLVGDALTLADIAVASPFANAMHAGIKVDAEKYPRIAAFRDTMLARESFAVPIAKERRITGK